MNLCTGHAMSSKDIAEIYLTKHRLNVSCSERERIINDRHKDVFFIRIFHKSFEIMLNDIIENDVLIALPTPGHQAYLYIRQISENVFKFARLCGHYKDVDFIASNFKCNLLFLHIAGYGRIHRDLTIYLTHKWEKRITDYTNQGRVYYGKILKKLSDYIPQVCQMFPDLSPTLVSKILIFGWKQIYLLNRRGLDIKILFDNFLFYLGRFYKNSLLWMTYYKTKLANKIKFLWKLRKIPWDGYYYFALTLNLYDNTFGKPKKRGRPFKKFTFEKIIMYKLYSECSIRCSNRPYICRIKAMDDLGHSYYYKKFTSDKIELIEHRDPLKLREILISNNNYL